MDSSVAERVTALIAEHLCGPIEQVVPDAKMVEDLHADSLDSLELVMAIEDAFDGIGIEDYEFADAATVQDWIALVQRHVDEAAA